MSNINDKLTIIQFSSDILSFSRTQGHVWLQALEVHIL